jgi:hypothetical protein
MIPFRPEEEEALKARFPRALAETVDTEAVRLGTALPPTKRPANVFDYEDGMHLVVSRDQPTRGSAMVHVSASLVPNLHLFRTLAGSDDPVGHFKRLAEARFHALADGVLDIKLRLVALTAGGVIHWVEEKQDGTPSEADPV